MNDVKKTIKRSPYTSYPGVAAEDMEKDSAVLKVICPELLANSPFGTVGAGITNNTVSLKDRDGNPVSSMSTTANHLVATWEGKSNQRYAPLVRKGEPVEIYQIAGQDKFYWRETGRGRDFRTTDRVHIEIGATDPTKPGVTKDDTNTYSMWADSDQQSVGFKTSKKNGEAAAFSMVADLKAGTFHISDDSPDPANRIFLDTGTKSGTPACQINLTSGITFKLEGGNAYLTVPDTIAVQAGKRLIFNSPIIVFNLSQVGTIIFNAKNIAFNSAKDFVVTCGNVFGITAVSTKISGVLVANMARITTAVKGVFGQGYKPSTIQRPQDTPVVDANNSADTTTSGPPYQ